MKNFTRHWLFSTYACKNHEADPQAKTYSTHSQCSYGYFHDFLAFLIWYETPTLTVTGPPKTGPELALGNRL